MIISDRHKFAFIHIPKCAGTTVRSRLSVFDDYDGYFANTSGHHSELGEIDTAHMPLKALMLFFRDAYEKVKIYNSFAVLRDPHKRFISSVAQHLAMYGSSPLQRMNAKELKRAVNSIMEWLSSRDPQQPMLDREYIHFQRQVDYVFVDGEKVVSGLYLIQDVSRLLEDLESLIGSKLPDPPDQNAPIKAKQTVVYRHEALRIIHSMTRPVANKLIDMILSEGTKSRLKSRIYKPQGQHFDDVFGSETINAFVQCYYKEDLRLVSELTAQNPQG